MKKILLLVLIGIMLSGCTEEVVIVRNEETVLTEEEKKVQMDKLKKEWLNTKNEFDYAFGKQPGTFGIPYSFTDLLTTLWYQFNSWSARDEEAARYLDDMLNTYAKCNLLFEKTELDVTSGNINEFKEDLEYFKILVKCIQNDRRVMLECNNKTGKLLINHKKNDPLYEKLKQYLNSLQ